MKFHLLQDYQSISNEMRQFYFDGEHVNAQTLDKMNMLAADSGLLYSIDLSARIQATKSSGQTYFAR